MVNKIIAIADIHFRNYKRRDEFNEVCEDLYKKVKLARPDRIVIAGDIVHGYTQLTPELVLDVSSFLRKLSELTNKVIIIPGNHDYIVKNKLRLDSVTPIVNALNIDNIVYYKKSGVYFDENIAWTVFSLFDDNARPKELDNKDSNYKYVGLYHGNVLGMLTATGFELRHGSETDRFEGCDVVICGDIHKRQVLKMDNGEPIIMIGSMIQQSFGETLSQHGYLELKINPEITYGFTDLENNTKHYNFVLRSIDDIKTNGEILLNA
jgi:DNA repair exonuclease SbcCD nuclease subunit